MSEYNPIFPIACSKTDMDLDINVGNTGMVMIDLAGGGGGKCKVLYDTTENWNSQPQMVSKRGYIYVYSDYKQIDGKYIAGIKVGDGQTYLIDMAFVDEIYAEHIQDVVVHITDAEREFWNNKVRCYMVDETVGENLIFTTH